MYATCFFHVAFIGNNGNYVSTFQFILINYLLTTGVMDCGSGSA